MTIDFDKMGGLVPAIIQDADTRQVLMLGYMNREAYDKTISTGKVTFWSRTRETLWSKGETSGHFLDLVSIANDCDNDTLLVKVHPYGPTCHTGTDTCWGEENKPCGAELDKQDSLHAPLQFVSDLQDFIEKRKEEMPEGSYTTRLFRDGIAKISQKVGEEALETVIEAINGPDDKLIYEAGDMIYHLLVLLTARGLRIEDIAEERRRRHDPEWDKKRRTEKALKK